MPQICILFKTKCLPPFPLKIIWIRHFWANSLKKKKEEEKKKHIFFHSPPSCSFLNTTSGQFTSEQSRLLTMAQWQIGIQVYCHRKHRQGFLCKNTGKYTCWNKRHSICTARNKRNYVFVLHTSYTHLFKKKKKQLYTYFNYDIFYPFLNPGPPQNNFF